jgi:soluble lytic murein transglycosylase
VLAVKCVWLILIALFLIMDAGLVWWWRQRREHRFDREIAVAARRYQMDPALIKAVIWRESSFNPDAVGTSGELGLMQVGDLAAHEWADAEKLGAPALGQLTNPATNILAGAWYLKKLLGRYHAVDDPVPYALADYNAGRSHSLKWSQGAAATNSVLFIEQISFPTTQSYVREILHRQSHYRKQGSVQE